MAVAKILLGFWSVAAAVVASDCENTTLGRGDNPVVDWLGNVWFSHAGKITKCSGDGQCISKRPPKEFELEAPWDVAVDASHVILGEGAPPFLVYYFQRSPIGEGKAKVIQCIWVDGSANEEMSCSLFVDYSDDPDAFMGTGVYLFVDHAGSAFTWHTCGFNSSTCGLSRCSPHGECQDLGGNLVFDFNPSDAVVDFQGNIYASRCPDSMCVFAKCNSAGECAEMTFTAPDGSQLRGAIAIDSDQSSDHPVLMVDFLPGNYGYIGLFQCSPDGACERVSILGPSTINGTDIYRVDHFSVGNNGDYYTSTNHCVNGPFCEYDVVRRCFPPLKEVQV